MRRGAGRLEAKDEVSGYADLNSNFEEAVRPEVPQAELSLHAVARMVEPALPVVERRWGERGRLGRSAS
jgi:hypothetical protein